MLPEYHNDYKFPSVNADKAVSYFIPFENAEEAKKSPREASPRFTLLNGEWSFKYYTSFSKLDWDFLKPDFAGGFEMVTVPGMWHTYGYDHPAYIASPYPIMFIPPYVPKENPCGVYVLDFDCNKKEDRAYKLVFEGVDSCEYVFLNGEFVGYSEVSHCASAYDITPFLKNGSNRLAVCVLKYCNGTYFEDQDKIRMSGIFRDVYILERDKTRVEDIFIKPELDGSLLRGTVTCELKLNGSAKTEVSLLDGDRVLATQNVENSGTAVFTVEAPRLWSAEKPNLYGLLISCGSEVIYKKFGFRKIEIKNGVFYINNVNVKLKGVNRHDSHPEKGYAVAYEDIKKDLLMMKDFNINCVRTSHYPNDARFYELCDTLGIYVCAEADIEAHGAVYINPIAFTTLNDDEKYEHIFIDRTEQMVEALKNNTCIVMFSLGNESRWGKNLAACSKFIKKKYDKFLVHYESCFAFNEPKLNDEARAYVDFYSQMYPAIDGEQHPYEQSVRYALEHFNERPAFGKPFFLCEFTHAMGNSCGDVNDYAEVFYSSDNMVGGCVWEWCDHAVLMNKNGKKFLGYGGDLGDEDLNTGNICNDGLVSPYREPHSALFEVKNAYSPVVAAFDGKGVKITNRYDFTSLSEITAVLTLMHNGETVWEKRLSLDTAPHNSVTVTPEIPLLSGEVFLHFDAFKGENRIYHTQFELKAEKETEETGGGKIELTESGGEIIVSGNGFEYTLSADTPTVEKINYNGRELLTQPQQYSLFRAPIDNDRTMAGEWSNNSMEGNLRYAMSACMNVQTEQTERYALVTYDAFVGVKAKAPVFAGKISFKFFPNGLMLLEMNGNIRENLTTWLPRFGLKWALSGELTNAEYFGLGPHETYCDKRHAGKMLVFKDNVANMYNSLYIKPQETGSHFNTKWVSLCDNNGFGVTVAGNSFSFSAQEYDEGELADKKHTFELEKSGSVILHTDYFMSGVGSNSCGPKLCNRYKVPTGEMRFSLALMPYTPDGFTALKRFNFAQRV